MITYEGTEVNGLTVLNVKLDGKLAGRIRRVEGGYQYFPKSDSVGGEIFPTLQLCKQSLEG